MEVGGNKSAWFDPAKVSAACGGADSNIAEGAGASAGAGASTAAEAKAKKEAEAKAKAKAEADVAAAKAAAKAADDELKKREKAEAAAKAKEEAAKEAALGYAISKSLEEDEGMDTTETQAKLDKANAAWDAAKTELALAHAATQGAKETWDRKMVDANSAVDFKEHFLPKETGTREPSACEQALQGAREILSECNRNGWKSSQCQQLQAKMYGCPDPTQIFVDPDAGYVCGGKVDAKTKEALKKAWIARCEELKRGVGPEANPCEPPVIDESGRHFKGRIGDVCNDPHAYILPQSEECVATFVMPTHGTDLQKLLVFGINKFGGSIWVLPPRPNPEPGGGPTPPR
jgi:hypothetical protein